MLRQSEYLLDPYLPENALSEAFKLRYIAYRNVNAIDENPEAVFRDRYDLLESTRTCLVYEQGAPVASIRACIYKKEQNFLHLPSFEVYRSEIEKELGLDKTILESNRYVVHPEKMDSKLLFKIPFRFIVLNVIKNDCDYFINAVRPRHVPLYKRVFGMRPISDPRIYPGTNVEMILMANECSAILPTLEKEELFQFTEEEINTYPSFPGVALQDPVEI